uniref:Phosphoribulokinase/uridine kinase domain-containing protein n=1 Tax=Noctiluca scintillans TaxID=2966 RepID=A0A7S1F9L1_NOCSC|mmetsp:Transcript_43628/g.115264  ORF Transcript_43628/g.115264 Transcript_43628/m.115264 type:complete len:359 (+) Transcript_43628:18-1094(+)
MEGSGVSAGVCRNLSADAEDFIRRGPLYNHLLEPPSAWEWTSHGQALVLELTNDSVLAALSPCDLDHELAVRVYHLSLPIYFWLRHLVHKICAEKAASTRPKCTRTVLVGLSAPQGFGKTTLLKFLEDRFRVDGLGCASLSIDDFYLTGAELEAVATANADNALMQVRGHAGTHDIPLGVETLRALQGEASGEAPVPRFHKAARSGKGDRCPKEAWSVASTPCDVVILEGWMLGFKPVNENELVHPGLVTVNKNLPLYQAWTDQVDIWCVAALSEYEHVTTWRLEAEHEMIASGKSGMDDAQIRDFVSRYMPAYETYCPSLHASAQTCGVDGKPSLFLEVDGNRTVISACDAGVLPRE